MTPDEALDCAVETVKRRLGGRLTQMGVSAYEPFLYQSDEHLELASRALTRVAMARPTVSDREVAKLEEAAYFQALQAAISVLMALAHFPYLPNVDTEEVREKLCLESLTDTSES